MDARIQAGRMAVAPAWRSARPVLTPAAILILALTILYGAWPYVTLWRLELAAARDDRVTLVALVDLEAVRDEIARRLDKDRVSAIGAVSESFIEWLESGLRRYGAEALQRLVTLDWVGEQFNRIPRRHSPGLRISIPEIFFDAPDDVRVRIERAPIAPPLYLRLQLQGHDWRVTMIHD